MLGRLALPLLIGLAVVPAGASAQGAQLPDPGQPTPTLIVPGPIVVQATTLTGAVVTFSVTSSLSSEFPPTCVPTSGSTFPVGTTSVHCEGHQEYGDFTVTVTPYQIVPDPDPGDPTLGGGGSVTYTIPSSFSIPATSPDGAIATFTATSSDAGSPVTCDPASGSLFKIGATVVTCRAPDPSKTMVVVGSFTITVTGVVTEPDVAGPDIPVSPITVNAPDQDGIVLDYDLPVATDADPIHPAVTCLPAPGSRFAPGDTTVTCSATDAAGNTTTARFTVTVVVIGPPIIDKTDPEFKVPDDIAVEADSFDATGAVVVYDTPVATDENPAHPEVTCDPASGTTFPVGTTRVTCEATDAAGNTTRHTFTVRVDLPEPPLDKTGPELKVPADITAEATSPDGAVVTYDSPTASDQAPAHPDVTCDPASGSTLPLGPTTVECSATDAAGNTTRAKFSVTVVDTTKPDLHISGAASASLCAVPAAPTFAPTDSASGIDPARSAESWIPATVDGLTVWTYTATATDLAGNTRTGTRGYTIDPLAGDYSGVLQPLNRNGSSRFRLGSTIPVKFRITCNGVPTPDLVVRLSVKQADETPGRGETKAVPTAPATDGNLFRYDEKAGQYVFNLSTKARYTNPNGVTVSFRKGTWTLVINFGRGVSRVAMFQLVR